MEDSILISTKKVLGIQKDLTAFDQDILMNINSVFSILYQIGVMSSIGTYRVEDETDRWEDYFGDDPIILDLIKTYVYAKVRIIFDPPSNSFVLESLKSQAQELEWRIYIEAGKDIESEEEDEVKPGKVLSEADITNIWEEIIGSVPGITSGSPMTDEELEAIWEEIIGSLPSISDKTVLTTEEVKEIWKEIMGNVPNTGESTESITGLTDEELDKIWDDIIGKKTDKSTMSDEDIVELWNDIMY